MVLSPDRPLELVLAHGNEFVWRCISSGKAVIVTVPDRHHRLAGINPLTENFPLRGFGVNLDADLQPGVMYQLEEIALFGAFPGGLYDDLQCPAIGHQP